ncbi:MAG: hypothetical protein HKN82_09745 [Akkermansiaceae bacterium]|nr:hypothetical protein [Akkermansiaceae bacterium]
MGILLGGMLHAQEAVPAPVPPLLPDHAVVARLIAEQADVKASDIAVAVVIGVEAEICKGVKAKHSAQAIFMWRVVQDGRLARRAGERTFHWNEDLGWFMYRVVRIRGGEAIDICSEHHGLIQVR